MNTTNLLIKIAHHSDISQPDYITQQNAIVITSPVDIELEKRSDAWIDLKFDIEFESNNHFIWIKPSTVFGSLGVDISDKETWIMNKTKQSNIALQVLNSSFYYKVNIKKGDILGYAFIIGEPVSVDIQYKIKNN